MQRLILYVLPAALLVSGCSFRVSSTDSGTPTPFIITVTLPPGSNPQSTETVAPPTQLPTAEPVEGTTTTQVNVRGEPSTASAPLGMIGPSTKVQIIGKDPSGNWAKIIYPPASNGTAWLTLQYIEVKDPQAIPVIGIATGSASGPSGAVIQQVNVRSGPGTDFSTLGILNPKDVVVLTGRDPSGIWLQIQFTGGPEGRGWVTAGYVQSSSVDTLPVVGQAGQVIGTVTPESLQPTIPPTVSAALQDNDSAQVPAVEMNFTPSGARSLIYSSDVSTPEGDHEDWIQFTPYTAEVIARLTCTGTGKVSVELLQNDTLLKDWGGLTCNGTDLLNLSPGLSYLMHLIAVPQSGKLTSVHYTITIESTP